MITLATAECFTHGKIGLSIHKAASGYEEFEYKYLFSEEDLKIVKNVKVLCSMFLPSIYAIEKLFNISLPKPDYYYKYAKAYSEKNDLAVAKKIAESLKDKLNPDIALASTAGVGRGAICIIADKCYLFTTDVYANLLTFENVKERQKDGIEKGIKKVLEIVKKCLEKY
ncbi:hypothetical protein J422_04880 [Methanocaldococcus villosus KIN24-T80]|uniref:UPF0254 protein J422_04880 n=1 Tax=Methanocaldococcus villosus KIN24-T80 TaxID=1069083 RepID=N6V0W6_9EURY|nr:UPF0254 family protein [Methanocaldococcus villosus]ENN95948.1 hypothetical protein J422_04880 [Methanocaldococcus villosus KIN24-T80]